MKTRAMVLSGLLMLGTLGVFAAGHAAPVSAASAAAAPADDMPMVVVQADEAGPPTAAIVVRAHRDSDTRSLGVLIFSGLLVLGGVLLASVKRLRFLHFK